MNEGFISDLTICKLSQRFRGILSFYESSEDWHKDFNRCGFYAESGSKSFFEVVNGPWPRAEIMDTIFKEK